MRELTDQELMVYAPDDLPIYFQATDGLPRLEGFKLNGLDKYNKHIPYGSGPHIVAHIRSVLGIVKPKNILEIGFNLGYGSGIFLLLSDANVVSTDISDKDETLAGAKHLQQKYGDRFKYYPRSELPRPIDYFDLIFIDGGHDESDVTADIQLAKDLNIPYLLLDDWYNRFGPGVQPSFAKFPLKIIKDMDNVKLATWVKD